MKPGFAIQMKITPEKEPLVLAYWLSHPIEVSLIDFDHEVPFERLDRYVFGTLVDWFSSEYKIHFGVAVPCELARYILVVSPNDAKTATKKLDKYGIASEEAIRSVPTYYAVSTSVDDGTRFWLEFKKLSEILRKVAMAEDYRVLFVDR